MINLYIYIYKNKYSDMCVQYPNPNNDMSQGLSNTYTDNYGMTEWDD